jgi:hypothetical protein
MGGGFGRWGRGGEGAVTIVIVEIMLKQNYAAFSKAKSIFLSI